MDLVENKVKNIHSQLHPWETVRYEFFKKKIQTYIDLNSKNVVIDIGCGDGFFISTLSKGYPNLICIGVDINFTEENLISLNNHGLSSELSFYRTVAEALKITKRVDLILLMDVIEHIEEDISFLKDRIQPIVKEYGSTVFLTVPAYQSLFNKHDIFLVHYRRYNNRTLNKAINTAGLKSVETGYFFFTLIFFRMLEILVDKFTPNRKADGLSNWNAGPFVTWSVLTMLRIDTAVSRLLMKVGIKFPGLSNYTVIK